MKKFEMEYPQNLEEALKMYAELSDKYDDVRLEKETLSHNLVLFVIKYR